MLETSIQHMFAMSTPVLEKIARPIIVYVFLVAGLRLGGKRELAQLNPFDLVVLLTLSNTVQNAIIGEDNTVTGGLLGAATLLLVNHVLVRYLYNHERMEQLVEGTSTTLIDHGVVQKDKLAAELISENELVSAARRQGFRSLDEVQSAVLDPGEPITFVGKDPSPAEKRHRELLERHDDLRAQLDALSRRLAKIEG